MTQALDEKPISLQQALGSLPPEAMDALSEISERISREFFRMLPAEDLYSEFLLWLAENPGHAAQWHFVGSGDEVLFGWKSFRRDAAKVMATSARKWKAKTFGYDPEDEVFYAKAQVSELLKYVFGNQTQVGAVDGPQQEKTGTRNDPKYGGDRFAAIMDVRNAYRAVIYPGSQWDQILESTYRLGHTQRETAAALGISQTAVSKNHDRAMQALLTALNGTLPMPEGPGSRKAISNAAAQAVVKNQEG